MHGGQSTIAIIIIIITDKLLLINALGIINLSRLKNDSVQCSKLIIFALITRIFDAYYYYARVGLIEPKEIPRVLVFRCPTTMFRLNRLAFPRNPPNVWTVKTTGRYQNPVSGILIAPLVDREEKKLPELPRSVYALREERQPEQGPSILIIDNYRVRPKKSNYLILIGKS